MQVIAIVALLGGMGYGFENDWKIALKAISLIRNVVLKIQSFITQ